MTATAAPEGSLEFGEMVYFMVSLSDNHQSAHQLLMHDTSLEGYTHTHTGILAFIHHPEEGEGTVPCVKWHAFVFD